MSSVCGSYGAFYVCVLYFTEVCPDSSLPENGKVLKDPSDRFSSIHLTRVLKKKHHKMLKETSPSST